MLDQPFDSSKFIDYQKLIQTMKRIPDSNRDVHNFYQRHNRGVPGFQISSDKILLNNLAEYFKMLE